MMTITKILAVLGVAVCIVPSLLSGGLYVLVALCSLFGGAS